MIKKEGLFRRLKNIKSKNEEQLKAIEKIKNNSISSKPLEMIGFFSIISEEANKLMKKIKILDDRHDSLQLICTKTDGTLYDFNKFSFLLKFASKIYILDLTLQEAEDEKLSLKILMNNLNKYNPRNSSKVNEKNNTLVSVKKLLSARQEIINAFKKGIFPYKD